MKKLILGLAVIGVIFFAGFAFLLGQAAPDKAPSQEVIVDLTETLGS